jgi:hypothetical protein
MRGYKAWKAISGWVCFGLWAAVVLPVVLGASGRLPVEGVRPSRARGAGPTVGTQECVLPPFFEDVKVGGRYGSEVDRRVRAERREGERNGLSWDVALPVVEAGPPEGRQAFREWMERAVGRRVEEEIRGFEEFVAEEKDKIPAENLRAFYELRFAVGYLDDRLVSVLMCEYHSARWAAHPFGSAWVVNFRLDEGRPLEAAEMFRRSPKEVWLKDCVRRDGRYREWAEGLDCSECEDPELEDEYRKQDWDRVLLTAKGPVFIFDTYHVYGDYLGCLIAWGSARRALRPEFRRLVGLR